MQPLVKAQSGLPDQICAEQLGVGRGQITTLKEQRLQRGAEIRHPVIEPGRQGTGRGSAGAGHAKQNHAGPGVQRGAQCRPQPGQKLVIGVQKEHPVPGGRRQSRVARRPGAAVFAVQRPHAGVLPGQSVAERPGPVWAAVIHQEQLQIFRRVQQRTVHRPAQRCGGAVAGNDDRDGRQRHIPPSLLRILR